jgi:hypothetical protein
MLAYLAFCEPVDTLSAVMVPRSIHNQHGCDRNAVSTSSSHSQCALYLFRSS